MNQVNILAVQELLKAAIECQEWFGKEVHLDVNGHEDEAYARTNRIIKLLNTAIAKAEEK